MAAVDAIHFEVLVFDGNGKEQLTTGRLAVFPVDRAFAKLRWEEALPEGEYTLKFDGGKEWRVGLRPEQEAPAYAAVVNAKVPDFLLPA